MPPPDLQELLVRLEGLDLSWQVGRDGAGELVVQIRISDSDLPPDPLPAPPAGGAAEPVTEPAEAPREEGPAARVVLPRVVPDDEAGFPLELVPLAARLPASAGRLCPPACILQAARLGTGGRAVANGDARFPASGERVGLPTRVYVVLVAQDGSGPWICRRRIDYLDAVGEPFAPRSVSRAFASDAEAISYLWGSGLQSLLAPPWR